MDDGDDGGVGRRWGSNEEAGEETGENTDKAIREEEYGDS